MSETFRIPFEWIQWEQQKKNRHLGHAKTCEQVEYAHEIE